MTLKKFTESSINSGVKSINMTNESYSLKTSIGYWPASYRNIINRHTGTTWYVNANGGSDSNSGLSINLPKLTIQNAISNATGGDQIIVYPGTYTNNTTGDMAESSYNNCLITDLDKQLEIFFAPGQTILTGTNSGSRDFHISSVRNRNTRVFGAIFKRNNGGRTASYSNAFFGFSAGETGKVASGKFYNCVFEEINGNGLFSMHYDNNNIANWMVAGCAFKAGSLQGNYSGGNSTSTVYSVCNLGFTTSGQFLNNATDKTFNASYQVDSTNYGVYFGTYSW